MGGNRTERPRTITFSPGRRSLFSSRRQHTRFDCDWSSDVCSSDLTIPGLDFFQDDVPAGDGTRQALLHVLRRNFQKGARFLDEFSGRNANVPLLAELLQQVKEARFGPQRRIRGKPKLLGEPVCGYKAKAAHFRSKAVGVFTQYGQGFLPIGVMDPKDLGRSSSMGLKEQHEALDPFVLFPSLGYGLNTLGTDTTDLVETCRFF